MKFAIGDIVVEKTQLRPHTSYNAHKVVGVFDGALLLEHYGFCIDGDCRPDEWTNEGPGSRGWRESLQRYQESELFTPEEAVQELHRLEAAKDKMSEEFEAVRDQLQSKLDQAAALVKEAADLVNAHDKEFCDLKHECMPLYRALDSGGWRHSHMQC